MEFGLTELFTILIVLLAYFVKGFSGFGPALVLVPVLTILYDPQSAISTAALFDIIAGPLLLIPILKKVDWKFVLPVVAVLFVGAYLGVQLIPFFSTESLKKIIGVALLLFVLILISQKNDVQTLKTSSRMQRWLRFPIVFFAGLSGGLIGITGPPLVIYMKFIHKKDYFRNQLIAIFTIGATWRFLLYMTHGIEINIAFPVILVLIPVLLSALWIGQHVHGKVNERRFNQVIAIILLLPIYNLLFN